MIIRKPYAFLIRNFKKIHIALLLLSLFVVYKLFDVSSFVNDFMRLGSYDFYLDPITNHISFLLLLSVFLIFLGSLSILILLRYKNKQWKIYLIPVIEYLILFFVLNMIKNFFDGYTNDVKTTDIRLTKDLLLMFTIAQIPAIVTFVIRVFGLDKKKFNFNTDQEFLELSEKDREEVEINLDIDKNSIARTYKRIKRNIGYFYTEHKAICISIVSIFIIGVAFTSYKHFFVTNKSYKEGELYSANGYTIKINDVYFTDKDYKGDIISKKSNFIIVRLDVKNNSEPRVLELDNFHIKNGTSDFAPTRKTYEKEFIDLGDTYSRVKELKRDEKVSFILVYKVDKDLKKDKFIVCYQENEGILRKIKVNVKDISEIEKQKNLKLGDYLKIEILSNPDTISIDYIEVTDTAEYTTRSCNANGCAINDYVLSSDGSYKILKLEFASELYGASKMITFLERYGKIIYKNSDGEEKEVEIKNAISRKYYGKVVYLKLPKDVTDSTKLTLNLKIRNKEYNYKLN